MKVHAEERKTPIVAKLEVIYSQWYVLHGHFSIHLGVSMRAVKKSGATVPVAKVPLVFSC
jgi:hypothetical protein